MDINNDWNEATRKYSLYGTLEDFKNFIGRMKESDIQCNDVACNDTLESVSEVTLNKQQEDLINLIKQQIQQITLKGKSSIDVARRIIVQGKAGKLYCFVFFSFISEHYEVLIEIFSDFRYREKCSDQSCNQADRKKLG